MKHDHFFWALTFMLVVNNSWAYGGGGSSSSKACAKPKFSDFVPAENAQVPAGSNFSFTASKNTFPNTIKVTVKGVPSAVTATSKSDGSFAINGKLPAAIKGDYARISISADAQSNCKGTGGWLVKIAE